jgi:hypothetical protein
MTTETVFEVYAEIEYNETQKGKFKFLDDFSRKDTALRYAGRLRPGRAWKVIKRTKETIAESKP